MEIKEFIIKRSRWIRGESADKVWMLRPSDKKMDCLGFFAKAYGFPDEKIINVRLPSQVFSVFPIVPKWLKENEGLLSNMNDGEFDSGEERESDLREFMSMIGFAVKFVD